MQDEGAKAVLFKQSMLAFWDDRGRKHLPWRSTKNAWHILLAEILLRKTTAAQATDAFNELAGRSPCEIAEMQNDRLEEILQPIGMFRVRARQLRLIATAVATAGPGALERPEFLRSLPGVGRYIENTVLCFGFGAQKPALDTNMIRVLQRFFGVGSNKSRAREDGALWDFAESLVPAGQCREFNWGIIDFGDSVCKARKPRCSECPLSELCSCRMEGSNGIETC